MGENTTPWQHRTVLLHEAVQALLHRRDGARLEGTYVDGTYGRGGHSRLILQQLGPAGRLIAIDRSHHFAALPGKVESQTATS